MSVLDLLLVSTIIIFGRFTVLLWQDNKPGWKQLDKGVVIGALPLTFWLSIPFLILVGALSLFWSTLNQKAETYMISRLATPGQNPKTLEEAMRQASSREQQRIADKSKASIANATAAAKDGTKKLVDSVMPNVRASFPPYLMELRGCRWYDIFCHVVNGLKSVVNSIYRKARDAALSALEAELRRADAYSQGELDKKRALAEKAVNNFSTESTRWADIAIMKAFEASRWMSFILGIYGALVVIKTIMIILSRFLYRDEDKNKAFASLRPDSVRHVSNRPKVLGNEVEIPKEGPDTYVALAYEIRNAVANVSLPQPLTGFFGRLLSGRYVLGLLRSEQLPADGASIVVNAPSELVSWTLAPGEEVLLRYSDLVAFSSTVRLATEVNLSLQATLFGRFIFYKAVGPGVIVMRTEGEAVAGRERDAAESRRATSLKAWEAQGGFQIQSNLDWRGVYLAPYNIRRMAGSMVIYDAGPKNTRWSPIGLIKAVRTFLLPF